MLTLLTLLLACAHNPATVSAPVVQPSRDYEAERAQQRREEVMMNVLREAPQSDRPQFVCNQQKIDDIIATMKPGTVSVELVFLRSNCEWKKLLEGTDDVDLLNIADPPWYTPQPPYFYSPEDPRLLNCDAKQQQVLYRACEMWEGNRYSSCMSFTVANCFWF